MTAAELLTFPALATALATAIAATAAPAQELNDAEIASCSRHIEAAMREKKIPGLSVAIGRRGTIAWTTGFGHADLENQVAATADTVYRLASISKPITAVAVMQLVERGKLDLDAPVQTYVEAFPNKRFVVTTRHLLSHQGGVRHYQAGEIFSTRHYNSVPAALLIFAADPLLHPPGDKFRYTTYGYNLVGAAAVGASGQRFVAYLHKHIFEPAGMAHTRVDSIATLIPHRAQGYRRNELGKLLNSRIVDTSNKIPGGGLCGTASDLVRFCHALAAGKLLQHKTLDLMWTPARSKAGKSLTYGLGFGVARASKPRIVNHSGGQPRVNTMLVFRPDEAVAVALMCNLEGAGLRQLARQLSDIAVAGK